MRLLKCSLVRGAGLTMSKVKISLDEIIKRPHEHNCPNCDIENFREEIRVSFKALLINKIELNKIVTVDNNIEPDNIEEKTISVFCSACEFDCDTDEVFDLLGMEYM